jgi:hypothetical protein
MVQDYEGFRKGYDHLRIPLGQGFLKQSLYTTYIRITYDIFKMQVPRSTGSEV